MLVDKAPGYGAPKELFATYPGTRQPVIHGVTSKVREAATISNFLVHRRFMTEVCRKI